MADYPLVEITVIIGAQEFTGEALPDTGYDGAVIVPEELVGEIDADPVDDEISLADYRSVEVRTWDGAVQFDTRTFDAKITAFGDQFILGREVLDRLEICFEFGRQVRLRFEE